MIGFMTTLFLNAFTDYLCDWIYYLFSLLCWIQLIGLSFLFALQIGLETELALQFKRGSSSIVLGCFAFLACLGLLRWGARNVFLNRIVVSPKTYWNLGVAAERAGAFPKAISYFRKAEEEGENKPSFYLNFAEALHQNHQDVEALVATKNSREKSMQKYLMMGRLYFSSKHYQQAKQFLEIAQTKAPDDIFVQAWLGETYLKLHDSQKAIEAFTKVLNARIPKALRAQITKEIAGLKTHR